MVVVVVVVVIAMAVMAVLVVVVMELYFAPIALLFHTHGTMLRICRTLPAKILAMMLRTVVRRVLPLRVTSPP